ncbi:MAG: SGNH/GDSL hydrolase family protein [Myxococcales bacterium]|nr:SGNH/GDSL hydrolase family protein [Myxococcales bacterium]
MLGLLVLVACVPGYEGRKGGQTIAILGDSISTDASAGNAIRDALRRTYRVSISAVSGRRIGEAQENAVDYASRQFETPPDQVVINLGTNDAWKAITEGWNLRKSYKHYDAMIRTLWGAKCIHLVTVNAQMEGEGEFPGAYNAHARAINTFIRSRADAYPKVRKIDWNRAVRDYRSAGEPYGPLFIDQIHPNELGQSALAKLIRDSVDGCR